MIKNLILVFLLSASLSYAQLNAPPNLEGWKLVDDRKTNLEVKIQDRGLVYTAYVGYVEDYENPEVSGEFVRVIKRYIPVIPIVEDDQQKQTFQTEIISNYSRKASGDALSKVQSQSDVVGYTKWHVAKDLRTGEDIQTGTTLSWLRVQNGDWVSGPGVIGQEVYSEISLNSKHSILVGIKFSLGSKYHIVRVDQEDLVAKKGDKK